MKWSTCTCKGNEEVFLSGVSIQTQSQVDTTECGLGSFIVLLPGADALASI